MLIMDVEENGRVKWFTPVFLTNLHFTEPVTNLQFIQSATCDGISSLLIQNGSLKLNNESNHSGTQELSPLHLVKGRNDSFCWSINL